MIHYHGTPITPEAAAVQILKGRHAMVSYAYPEQIYMVAEVCHSFALDNGAFSVWKQGGAVNFENYCEWVDTWRKHPGFDWALIPDVIEGTEADNDELLKQWPLGACGVPVWHYHESMGRLGRLVATYPLVALGSSGEWPNPGTDRWWQRTAEAMAVCCDRLGRPVTKLHGLRMLDQSLFSALPFSSADSTNVARNIGLDCRWTGAYQPPSKAVRGIVLAERIESQQSAVTWKSIPRQEGLWQPQDAA